MLQGYTVTEHSAEDFEHVTVATVDTFEAYAAADERDAAIMARALYVNRDDAPAAARAFHLFALATVGLSDGERAAVLS